MVASEEVVVAREVASEEMVGMVGEAGAVVEALEELEEEKAFGAA